MNNYNSTDTLLMSCLTFICKNVTIHSVFRTLTWLMFCYHDIHMFVVSYENDNHIFYPSGLDIRSTLIINRLLAVHYLLNN